MSRIRFTSARDVFEAFPTAGSDIAAAPTDEPPLVFLKGLMASETPENAVTFCAYLLPRREAVWWACQCVRSLVANRGSEEEAALKSAEEWVREPEEERRRAALEIGGAGDPGLPTTWVALAAAYSGGSMTPPDQPPVPCQPHLTAKSVRAAVLTALARVPVKQRSERLGACLKEAMRLAGAEDGPARQ